MDHVIEIASFYEQLGKFIKGKGYSKLGGITIYRYFECLNLGFLCDVSGRAREVSVDVLPRIKASALAFQVNVNVRDEDESVEKLLSECLARFFAGRCTDPAADKFIADRLAEGFDLARIRLLFFIQVNTLLLRISV